MITRTRPAEAYLVEPTWPLRARLERFQRRRLFRGLLTRLHRSAGSSRRATRDAVAKNALPFTLDSIDEARRRVEELRDRRRVFRDLASHVTSTDDRRELLLKTARELGARGRALRRDAAALSRWFDETAMLERFERAIGETQQHLVFLLGQVGELAAERLSSAGEEGGAEVWREAAIEERFAPLLERDWDHRVSGAVLGAWREAATGLPEAARREAFSSRLRQRLTRTAQDRREPVWTQVAALDLLAVVDRDALRIILQQKLATPASGDDLFVREHIVRMIGHLIGEWEELASLVGLAIADPSPFVRQAVAKQLRSLPIDVAADYWLELAQDRAREVRGAAFDAVPHLVVNHDLALWLGTCVAKVLPVEEDPLVARIGIESLTASYRTLLSDPELAEDWYGVVDAALRDVQYESGSTPVRRWAAAGRERLWADRDGTARELLARLREPGVQPRPGRTRRLRKSFLAGVDRSTLGRVLAVLAQDDFPLDVEFGRFSDRLTRGFRFRFRFWRLLHEVRNPAPDKRQGYRHTIGRVHYGTVRAPSERLSELAETKVPGEPLYIASEDGWRPYLPLLDDFLSVLNQPVPGRSTRFFTAQGVTTVRPPRTLAGRLRAWSTIGRDFARIARLRNWHADTAGRPSAYLEELEGLGYEIEFASHDQRAEDLPGEPAAAGGIDGGAEGERRDETVRRHFRRASPVVAAIAPGDLVQGFLDYSLSLYENTLFDLALFVAVLGLFFLGRHAWSNWTLHRARRRLGLVVGGWGTRGKSSVERLKAALFNGLGYSVVSKTTGCEAMILYAPAFAEMRELFLFRPYDKATIWEQRNVAQIASGLGSDVLLWECMGLTPTYVDILQRQWMRDDLSTLTNTYPDHEDLQGPAGINIPMVMTLFIPTSGRLLSSEEQMLPILTDAARAKGTAASAVGWKEATLVPSDIQARFPYEEHPYNIALVARMASELGVTHAYAFKEMADRVVPDLGVLKTYPRARVAGRELEFSNGMSANERHGCLGNWARLGLDRHDPRAAGEWTTTVVNNRADRIPRSKVFADIVVADLSADRHFLIGGNLEGLVGYLDESWQRWISGVELWAESGDLSALERLDDLVGRFRQPLDRESLAARVGAMLGEASTDERIAQLLETATDVEATVQRLVAWDIEPEAARSIADHAAADATALAEVEALRALVEADDRSRARDELRAVLRRWFDRKIVVVDDYYATGDEIVDRIARETPPGYRNHVVGIQNIKGTGLDFVYRWLAWERCHRACRKVLAGDARTGAEGIEELASFREFGPLSEDLVREALAAVRKNPRSVGGQLGQLDAIESELERRLAATGATGDASPSGGAMGRLAVALAGHVEDLLDAGDAVRRRKKADQVFRDLVDQRVSVPTAIELLQDLTKRQKGGWLIKQLRSAPLLGRVFRV